MFKKSISILLVLIMAVCVAVPAFAADEADVLTEAQALTAAETGIAALVAEEDDEVTVDEDLADKIINGADTPEKISRAIAQFVFVEKSKVGELSDAIVADSKYTVTVTSDGKDTVYVAVSIIDHPEIYDARVFINVVKKLVKKTDEVAAANGIDIESHNYDPMLYSHIAGELSLHMITKDITEILGANDWNRFLDDYYNKSIIADLNVDESRLPRQLIEFMGMVLMFILDGLFD